MVCSAGFVGTWDAGDDWRGCGVEIAAERYLAKAQLRPPYDPKGEKFKA